MSAAPSQFPPPVDSAKEFVGVPTDAATRKGFVGTDEARVITLRSDRGDRI